MVRRHPATVFVLLTYAITWVVWVPRALVSQGLLTATWPVALGAFWTYGPALAAVTTAALAGRQALREMGSRLVRWRVRWWWYAVVLLGPTAFSAVVSGLAGLLGWSDSLRQPALIEQGLLAAGPLLLTLVLTDGLGEETGWRGFLLPRQLEHLAPFVASVVLGLIWALWHLPLFWTDGAMLAGSSPLVLLIELPAVGIVYTWVFEHTEGSGLLAILLHGASNLSTMTASVAGGGDVAVTGLVLVAKWVLALAVVLAWLRRPRPGRPSPTGSASAG